MIRELTSKEWGRIYAHAWLDTEFAEHLSVDPATAVKGYLDIDPDAKVRVHPIPPQPADLSAEQLNDVRSGKTHYIAMFSC